MEEVYKELEDMKHAMEVLTEKYQVKAELAERLKRAHDEQFVKLQEAKAEIEKQALEIDVKTEEISFFKQMYEDLKSNFTDKESALKHLRLANESLKTGFKEQVMKLELEKKDLICALDEANAKRDDQERIIHAYGEEIDGLKSLLSQSQRKHADLEERFCTPKELRRRDELLMKLEQEKGELENQLKWKSEQFSLLEEAHNRTHTELQASKTERELEKLNLFNEISSLQINLDSQTRVAEDFQCKLQMCNQALAHEESRRKLLEVQMSESKQFYENVVMEYEEAKLSIRKLTERRDEEIASLRNSLATKETCCKEMEFRRIHLEQDNHDLRISLKEFQEARISGAEAATSLKSLRQKFRALEQAHKSCSKKCKIKDTEWMTLTDKVRKDLDDCRTELSFKNEQLSDMQLVLKSCHSSTLELELQNEEMWVVLLVLKSKYSEFFIYLENLKSGMDCHNVKLEEKIAFLKEKLEKSRDTLLQSQAETRRERETIASLQERIKYLESVEQQSFVMKNEFKLCKYMLEELSKSFDSFKKEVSRKEIDLLEDLRKASDDLDQAKSVLAEKTIELGRVKFEMQQMKLVVEKLEKLKSDIEIERNTYRNETNVIRMDLEVSILDKMETEKSKLEQTISFQQIKEEKDKTIEDLQKQIILLEEDYSRRQVEAATLSRLETEKEKLKLLQIIEDEDRRLKSIKTQIDLLEQEYAERKRKASLMIEREDSRFLQFMKEKENEIADIQKQTLSLEGDFTGLVETASTFKLAIKDLENGTYCAALEKIVAARVLAEQEIQYNNFLISDMEEEIGILDSKLEFEKKLSCELQKCIERLKSQAKKDMAEKEEEKIQIENELKSMQCKNQSLEDCTLGLKAKLRTLLVTFAQLSKERKELVGQILVFSDQIEEAVSRDKELMKYSERLLQNVIHDDVRGEDLSSFNRVDGSTSFFREKKIGQSPDSHRRTPLKDHNC